MIEAFQQLLRDNGKSITKPRNQLFGYLQKSGPVSVPRLIQDNRAVADRASLYRALALFHSLGVIEDRIIRGQRMVELADHYDAHHHHLTCNSCGKTMAVTMPEIEQSLAEMCRAQGFEPEGHSIEVSGWCQECRPPAKSDN